MQKNKERVMNKRMIERLILIHNVIKAGMYPKCKDLRAIYKEKTGYNVGEATIYRDIEALRTNFKAPLEYDREKQGYYYFDDWEFSINQINADDIFYLSCAKTLLSTFDNSPVYNQIASVIDFVTQTQVGNKNTMLNRIAVPPLPKVLVYNDIWNVVIECLQKNTIIKFDYNGRWNTSTTNRLLRPYQVLLQDGMYFVFGFDENADGGKGGERLFNLSRIKNAEDTGRTFELPKDFEFASRCGGGRFGAFKDANKVHYEIEFYDDARKFVKDCVWADDQEFEDYDEDSLTVMKFSSSQSMKVMEWVLSLGANARPVAPADFVERWQNQIRWMAESAGILKQPDKTER